MSLARTHYCALCRAEVGTAPRGTPMPVRCRACVVEDRRAACLYCEAPMSAAQTDAGDLACGCESTPAPHGGTPRCAACGEFPAECECGAGVSSHPQEFGFGSRMRRGGED